MSPARKVFSASFSAEVLYASTSSGGMPWKTELILETVDVILRREMLRRTAIVAQQVADRIVILAMRQPANHAESVCCTLSRQLTALGSEPVDSGGPGQVLIHG